MRLRVAVVAGVAAAFLGAAGPASADLLTYDEFTVVNSNNVYIQYPSPNGATGGPYGSGQIDFYNGTNSNNQTLVAQAWCIDVTHDLYGNWGSVGSSYTFNVIAAVDTDGTSNIDNMGGMGTLLSWQRLGELGALAYYGDQHLTYSAITSSAIQDAIWEVEYGTSNITITQNNGNATAINSLVKTLVWDAEHGALGYDTDVSWLQFCSNGQCNQGQLIVDGSGNSEKFNGPPPAIPEPSTFALLGAGLLGLGAMVALRRRRGGNLAVR